MMKNKLILLALLLVAFSFTFAQKNEVELVSSDDNGTVLTFKVNSFDYKNVKTQNGDEVILISDELSPMLQNGFPDLPKFSESFIIPDMGSSSVEIISAKFETISDVHIAPSKGNLTRDIDPSTVPYEYGKVYTKDEFFPNNLAALNTPYIARDFRGQSVHVYPFTYNPVKKELRVYSEITVKVNYNESSGVNEFNRNTSLSSISKEFKNVYSSHFINFGYNTKYTPVEEEGNMLIICNDDWTSSVQPLVDWKNTIGRPCEMVTVTEAGGTSSAIGTFVEDYYNTNGLTFLLLIGDASQVPTNSGSGLGGDSDNAYAYISGNDHYLEFFVGRFSAENTTQLETQVLRTIEYEKGDMLTDGWLNKVMSIASQEGPGDDNEYDYQHLRNIQTDLIGFTYEEPIYEIFEGDQGGYDDPGWPDPSDVAEAVNTGVGFANYTGHGSNTSWGTSNFSVSDINSLTNDNMLPFIYDVACVNGNFVGLTCFGEAWLRAENNGEPTGAIAIAASTINQSWAPPMAAQDEMVDLIVGTSSNGIKRTFTGVAVNGMFLMNDEYSDFDMTDTWTTFGDPSLLIRTDDPVNMSITHNPVVIIGETTFEITCDLDNALATISRDGELIGSEYVSGGNASVPVSGITPGETLTLAVTGFNKVTYLVDLNVIAPTGPYMVVETYNNEVDFGQSIDLDVVLKNVGQDDANDVSVTITSSDPNAEITNGTYLYGTISAGSLSPPSTGAFTLTVSDDLEDQYQVAIDIAISDGAKTLWEQTKFVTVNAPVFEISYGEINDNSDEYMFTSSPITEIDLYGSYSYDIIVEGSTGNGNGLLDPGETVGVTMNASNFGHAESLSATMTMTASHPEYVTILNDEYTLGVISVDETLPAIYTLSVDESTPVGTVIELSFILVSGTYTEVFNVDLSVGLQIEDFESGDFNSYAWTMGGNADWTIDGDAHEGVYAAKSGDVSDNQDSELSVTINVAADGEIVFWSKVSSESGWDYLRFYIDGSMQDEWSGTESWTEQSYAVTAGVHTLKWAYEKDGSVSSGSDCAWIDDIIFPGHTSVTKSPKEITISATTLPEWLTLTDIGDGTGILTGTAPSSAGLHDVVLEANTGGDPISQVFTINVGNVSINEVEGLASVYPNPNNGKFYLKMLDLEGTADISVTDLNGKIIFRDATDNQLYEFDLTSLSKGVYFINAVSGNKTYNTKLILK